MKANKLDLRFIPNDCVVMYGYSGLVQHMIERTESEIGEKLYVIATGGLSRTIAPIIPRIDEVCPNQTLDGIKLISDLNS